MGKIQKGSHKPVVIGRKIGTPNKKTLVLSESLDAPNLDIPYIVESPDSFRMR